jgi:hypothetical protein
MEALFKILRNSSLFIIQDISSSAPPVAIEEFPEFLTIAIL